MDDLNLSFLDRLNEALEKDELSLSTPAEEDANFEIALSDFKFVTRGIANGKALRFTVTWKYTHPKYGLLGDSEEGWLATRSRDRVLRVAPPISRFGPRQSKQLKMITVDLHNLIVGMLQDTKTKSGVSYLDYVGADPILEEFKPKLPAEVDPELPEEINAK